MNTYGIVVNIDMIRNVAHTDVREVGELINIKLILLSIFCVVFCVFIAKIKIAYSPLKRHFLIKIANLVGSLIIFAAIFFPLTRIYVPFFLNYNPMHV